MLLYQVMWLAVPLLWGLLLLSYFSRKVYYRDRSMIFEASISLLSSLMLFFAWWLILPILVLLPLSLYFAFRCYRKTVARFHGFPILARVAGLLPMAVALATLPAINYFFADSYRA
ncbi:hypothetical protein [Massilia sp. CT11-137]|uniref:hypothetical protein n=1 Tax=Massilia sp. CT11-137 TaxID=3393901 RepID=UPI0039A543AA